VRTRPAAGRVGRGRRCHFSRELQARGLWTDRHSSSATKALHHAARLHAPATPKFSCNVSTAVGREGCCWSMLFEPWQARRRGMVWLQVKLCSRSSRDLTIEFAMQCVVLRRRNRVIDSVVLGGWSSLRRRCFFAEARGCLSRTSSPAAAACEWQEVTICRGVAERTVHAPYSASAIRCGGGDAEGDD